MFFPSRTVAVEFFGFSIHWYGLLYLLAFGIGIWLLPRLEGYRSLKLSADQRLSLLLWVIAGVLVGGRLGYVLFYEPGYFAHHVVDILFLWQGGMSSHGGFIGVALAVWLFTRREHIPFFALTDILVIPVSVGLALGRLGNFINQELSGTATTLPWGIPVSGKEGLYHPVQWYSMIKDLGIAGICWWYLTTKPPVGRVTALFLILYSVLRFLIEFVRFQDYPGIDIGIMTVTRGQALTIPLFIVGVWLWVSRKPHISL